VGPARPSGTLDIHRFQIAIDHHENTQVVDLYRRGGAVRKINVDLADFLDWDCKTRYVAGLAKIEVA